MSDNHEYVLHETALFIPFYLEIKSANFLADPSLLVSSLGISLIS